MKKALIVGNWKMNKGGVDEAVAFAAALVALQLPADREVAVAPPFTALFPVAETLRRQQSRIVLAAQNVHSEAQGAYTGEIAAPMLAAMGCSAVIIGHSERRTLFGEDDGFINRKVVATLAAGMRAILCVGENLSQREKGQERQVVQKQLEIGLLGVDAPAVGRMVVVAYEPVWAIGTGKTATPVEAEAVHAFIRERLAAMYGLEVAEAVQIIYGGSVRPDNIGELMMAPDVDGALVGGASLDLESFQKIICY